MKKKMLAMLTSLTLLLYSTPVMAADLPITISNSWTVQHVGGGVIRIPYLTLVTMI